MASFAPWMPTFDVDFFSAAPGVARRVNVLCASPMSLSSPSNNDRGTTVGAPDFSGSTAKIENLIEDDPLFTTNMCIPFPSIA
jgi:hypothetical protein